MNAEMSDCLHAHGTSTIPFLDEPTVIIYINIKNENLPEFREQLFPTTVISSLIKVLLYF